MACPICGDWKHVGTECPKKPAGWRPGVVGTQPVGSLPIRPASAPGGGEAQGSAPEAGAGAVHHRVKRRRAGQMIAPPGECAYCDRRRAAVIKAVKKYRGAHP
jgi:hypothetical protein